MNVSLANLDSLINCNHVYQGITFAESKVCSDGSLKLWKLNIYYIWLFISIFFFAVAINKLKPLIEKKKLEIEVNKVSKLVYDVE